MTRWLTLAILLVACSCDQKSYRLQEGDILIEKKDTIQSSTAGNLIASAIQKTYGLDIVLYPGPLIDSTLLGVASDSTSTIEQDRLISMFPIGTKDQFMLGTMTGKSIREFIIARSQEKYELELETAGVEYDLSFIGGYLQYASFSRERNLPLKDDEYYRVGVSKFYFFSGQTFPGYKYRNGFNFSFQDDETVISARNTLRQYLGRHETLPNLREIRARVRRTLRGNGGGRQEIHSIQGTGHRSPFYGKVVTTKGIVTATGSVQWYPGGIDAYIQSDRPDNDPRTSEGLHLHFDDETTDLEIGDEVEVTGVVYEQVTATGLGVTGLREISSLKKLRTGVALPPPVNLARDNIPSGNTGSARLIPSKILSSYRGNLNLKSKLTLTDGIDFWESLEGMRVKIENPQVVAFRGGQEDFASKKVKSYLNLYLRVNSDQPDPGITPSGGMVSDRRHKDFNPDIIQLVTNHLTKPFPTDLIFNVGDKISGSIVGVLGYEQNLFGEGEYVLVVPQLESSDPNKPFFDLKKVGTTPIELSDRPSTFLEGDKSHLTVAALNVENLSGDQIDRIQKLGQVISQNLKCPDIINFEEIQDGNGVDFSTGSGADVTLSRIIGNLNCPNSNYKMINIDPIANAEGGEPGGNIRVAMIYNANRVNFSPRGHADALTDAIIDRDGHLTANPSRVYPNDPAFSGTRRSLAAEFEFKGHQIVVIGNHLNSKLGDRSEWNAVQPPNFGSDKHRDQLADTIKKFVQTLSIYSPRSHIILAGDFNANLFEDSLAVLEGPYLKNLMSYGNLVAKSDRYSTSHNGSSEPLDYIFASPNLLARNPEFQVLHINTDYMVRYSDHDPVLARFQF